MSVASETYRTLCVRWTLSVVLAAMLVSSFVVIGSTTYAQAAEADDEEEDTVDTKFMRNFLTNLGLRQGNEPGIDYHERSPLVVPPTRDLPKPQTESAAVSNPAWPKDPDVQQKKKAKRERKNASPEEDMRQLSPAEMNAQRSRTVPASSNSGPVPNPDSPRAAQLMPSQLGFTGFNWSWKSFWDKEGTVVPFVKEPERTSLTEPPVGLRTPSSKYQYGSKNKLEPTRQSGADQAVGSEK